MVVMHTCDNRACEEGEHLVAGTQSDNIRDMYRKGRSGRTCETFQKYKHLVPSMITLKREGASYREIGRRLVVAHTVVSYYLRYYGEEEA